MEYSFFGLSSLLSTHYSNHIFLSYTPTRNPESDCTMTVDWVAASGLFKGGGVADPLPLAVE